MDKENKNKKGVEPEQTKEQSSTIDVKTEETKDAAETADTEADAAETGKTAEQLLDEANKQIEDLKDKLLRQMAEFDNYKKRTLKERTELILNGNAGVITAILPVIDDMERAVANAGKSDDVKAVEEGWELIFKKLFDTMKGLGVSKIETEGQDFDTDFHEAVAMVPGQPDEMKGKVIDCLQSGYKLNDKVLRHAKVAVGQ